MMEKILSLMLNQLLLFSRTLPFSILLSKMRVLDSIIFMISFSSYGFHRVPFCFLISQLAVPLRALGRAHRQVAINRR